MIEPKQFYDALQQRGTGFFSGVPDSLLKNFCAYITDTASEDSHIIAANEGSAVGLAAGYHLATGKTPLVYMQNSGLGNAVNPLLSLIDPDVYSIPLVLVIGWRGEPGIHDEPQHKKQGKATLPLLDAMGIPYAILTDNPDELESQVERAFASISASALPYAFVVRKDTFAPYTLVKNDKVDAELSREEAIEIVMKAAGEREMFVSTTGMASRELYELREKNGMGHEKDFLTVGSMGHASQIALSIALNKPERQVTCVDGDGAFLMHMGALATIGTRKPRNFRHIVLNNGAHDSVGGQPTVALGIDIPSIARAAGYASCRTVSSKSELQEALAERLDGPVLIEVRTKKGARKDLGRPKESPAENKNAFMEFIK